MTPMVRLALCLVAGISLWGCGGADEAGPDPAAVYDFVERLPEAELRREVDRIELGSDSARPFLREGWSIDADPRWATGERSGVDFFVSRPRALRLVLRGAPYPPSGSPAQRVTVRVNGRELGRLELRPGAHDYRVDVEPEHLRVGDNRLALEYARHRDPLEAGPEAADRRPFAARWAELRFDWRGAPPPDGEGRAERRGRRLLIPEGVRLDYFVPGEAGRELALRGVRLPRGVGSLRITVKSPGRPERELATIAETRDAASYPLLAEGEGPWRLSFHALGSPGPGGLERASLRAPVLRPADPPPSQEAAAERAETIGPFRAPNVILYLIDTLRPDHLEAYGSEAPGSPALASFAREAVVFEDVTAQSSWTRSAMASVFTGRLPFYHGAYGRQGMLAEDVDTMAEILSSRGYRSAAFVTNGNVSGELGFDQGFEHYRYLPEDPDTASFHQLSDALNREVFAWLDAEERGEPLFLYVHATDPHAPYTPPERFRRRYAPNADPATGRLDLTTELFLTSRPVEESVRRELVALYDAEIASNGHRFGAFLDGLRERGLYRDSLIVVLSDHGEEFYEHGGWGHGTTAFAEQVRVPLLLRLPEARAGGRRVAQPVRQIDLLPTLLGLLDEPPPHEGLPGRDLRPAIAGGELPPAPALSVLMRGDGSPRAESVALGGWKLVRVYDGPRAGVEFLGDRRRDPGDTQNLAGDYPMVLRRLSWLLERARGASFREPAQEAELDAATKRRLEALGYVQ